MVNKKKEILIEYFKYFLKRPTDFFLRLFFSLRIKSNESALHKFSLDEGIKFLNPDVFPQTSEIVSVCQKIYKKRIKNLDNFARENSDGKIFKPYFFNIMTPDELFSNKCFLNLCTYEPLIKSLTKYYGITPKLASVGLYLSRFNSEQSVSSQNFHLDGGDPMHVKFFMNIFDTKEENGPFTVYSKKTSIELINRYGYKFNKDKLAMKFIDDNVHESIKGIGKEGSTVVAETSTCIHRGSRCRKNKFRLVFKWHYTLNIKYPPYKNKSNLNLLRIFKFRNKIKKLNLDPLQKLVLLE